MESFQNNNTRSNQFIRGWSWGDIKVKQNVVEFESTNLQWFNLPYNNISNVLQPNKNEIGFEFNLDEEGDNK
jgi:hypothetical protein